MNIDKRFWQPRDVLSVRNVRFSEWNIVLLFAVGVIMGDMRLIELGDHVLMFDTFTIEVMGYGVGLLVFAFLKYSHVLSVGRFGALLALATLIAQTLAPHEVKLVFYSIFSFSDGLCIGVALFVFFYMMNNTERFFNVIIIQLYFGVCVYGIWENHSARAFITDVLVYALVGFFILSLFTIKKGSIPKKAPPRRHACGIQDDCCRVGKSGLGPIFYIYVIFMIMSSLNIFVVQKDVYVTHAIYSIGMLVAVVIAFFVRLLLGNSTLIMWKVFLVGTLVSMCLLALYGVFGTGVSSLLYGIAHALGFIFIFYIMGGAAHLTGCLKFFRLFCVIGFLISTVLDPVVENIFVGIDESNHLIALGILAVIVCVTLAIYPVLHKKFFDSNWINAVDTLNPEKFADLIGEVEQRDRAESLGLTPREKQIFTLMLTEMSVKQIIIELEISKGTFNYHTANIYRKLEIQSRTELFAKYGTNIQ